MNVHLVVPELFPEPERGDAQRFDPRAVALEVLLARGRCQSLPGAGLEAWLLHAFAVERQSDWPSAPYSLVADRGEPHGAWWLRADPVSLRADRDTVLFPDAALSDIAPDDAAALAASLNAHFAAAGITFHSLHSERWYAHVDREPAMAAPPPDDIRGQPLLAHMPDGPQGSYWRSVLNEIQMLLHEHPVNQSRESRGGPPINGLWLWGAGRIAAPARSAYDRVTTDNPVAKGLAMAAGKRHLPVPGAAGEWLATAGQSGIEAIILDSLRAPAARGDSAAWCAALETLERQWFAPLLAALRSGQIGMITLHAPGAVRTRMVETTRQDLRYFWRRRRPLAAYAS